MLTKAKARKLGWVFSHEDAGGHVDEDQFRVGRTVTSVPSFIAARFTGGHRVELQDETEAGLLLKIEASEAARHD